MPWNPTEIDSEILAVHAALVPSGPQGEVVLFGGDEHWGAQQESAGNDSWKKTRVYDVASHTLVAGPVQSPDSDVFCSHHVFVGDGRLLIAGGTSLFPTGGDAHGHDLDFLGHSRCWLYNPRQRQWIETARLNRNPDQPDEPRSGGRWYPGLVALGDGSAVAFFGHLDQNDFRHRNTLPERFFPSGQHWANLPQTIAKAGHPNENGRRFLFFVRGYVLPSGRIFSATPLPAEFDTAAGGSDGPHFSTAFDVETGEYSTPRAVTADRVDADWSFPSVLLPLLPSGGQYNARILYWSGAQPRWIDTDAVSPDWTDTGPRDAAVSSRARIYGQAVLLPTGQVCAVGGVANVNPEDPMGQAEIFTPDIDWTTNTYGGGPGSWSLEPGAAVNTRNYHSAALLLPNGRIWVAGGNVNGGPGNPDVVGIKKIELYEPPYIAVPNRLVIQSAPVLLGYGQEFNVLLDRAATNVGRAALIRNASVTHSTDNDQRYVGLEIVSRSGNTIRLKSPPNGNVAPPAYYMLWLVDTAGNPSQLATFVRLAHLSCRVVANRSTFSEEEVQALGGGANAQFAGALYVDFDGFIAGEITGTPSFTLEWSGGGAVPADQVTLQFAGRFAESSSPDVPTRISYKFDLIFPTMGAFSGWLDTRDFAVRFQLGHHSCQTIIGLTKSPNPYMIDIDPAAATPNPAWLSTDVRVFKVRPGQTRFGETLSMSGTGPWDYIRQVIDRLRGGQENFDSLPTQGSEATLDGAYMSGFPPLPTFNFAIARVRYRATMTTAQDVRCFFRLCNVAATGLGFDTNAVYRSSGGSNPVPLLGVVGGQLVSIPFFNAQRVNTVSGQSGATGMASQPLDSNYDIQDIAPAAAGAEATAFFGCFLDINLPTKRFPSAPGGDGPFPDADSRPIRDLLRSWHNCLVAEIVFAGDPTRAGAGPADSDNLAQRNLAIVGLENPGHSASRTAMHTFEIAPSQLAKGQPVAPLPHPDAPHAAVHGFKRAFPDELLFDWHNLPRDSEITLYFSDLDTAEIQAMLRARISPAAFTLLDDKTVRFHVGDCAWLPLPGGREVRIPALISIALPDGIVEGQVYRATIHQVNGRTSRIVGSVTIEMPVTKASFLRPEAERQLSFFGHVATTLAHGDRWKPLFDRLLAHLAAKVGALGGNPRDVRPNPDGTGRPYVPSGWKPGDRFPDDGFHSGEAPCGDEAAGRGLCWEAWVVAALLAIMFVILGIGLSPTGLAALAVAFVLLAAAGYSWSRRCRGRFLCRLLDALILGSASAAGALALGAIVLTTPVDLAIVAASALVAVAGVVASSLAGCRGGCCD